MARLDIVVRGLRTTVEDLDQRQIANQEPPLGPPRTRDPVLCRTAERADGLRRPQGPRLVRRVGQVLGWFR